MMYSHVGDEPIDVGATTEMVMTAENGAIATFLGTVRNFADGSPVIGLGYAAYTEMARKELATIVAEAASLAPGTDVAVAHRIGELGVGDVSVVIAVGHPHRAAAFDACRYVIEEIKRRLPIWKREHYASGESEWVTATGAPADHTASSADR